MSTESKKIDYLIFIAMLYITIDLTSMVFAYKIIKVGVIIAAASSIIFPMTYSIMDVVAEVYGYKTAKKIIFYAIICDFIFSVITLLISQIQSQLSTAGAAYFLILSPLLRGVFAQSVGMVTGGYINIYLVSKWKVLTAGRLFWLRSIGSSIIGEALMLTISVLISLSGTLAIKSLASLIFFTFLYKVAFAIIAAPIISLIADYLKYVENRIDSSSNTHSKDYQALSSA